MQRGAVNLQDWEPRLEETLFRRANPVTSERAAAPEAPVNDAEATDALLALAGPRGGPATEGGTGDSWKYRLAPQGRPNRSTGQANGATRSSGGGSGAMNSGDEQPEDAGQGMRDDASASTALNQARRGPYRRSTLDHMICQVEGCNRELASLSPYHRRYRICEMHFKLDVFVRDGRRQRFCQQCGRCHDLNAFEGSKRSCRNRLNQHNARRRKKNPGGGTGGGGGSAQQHERPDSGAPQLVNIPRGSRSGPSVSRPNAIRSGSNPSAYPPLTPGLHVPNDEGVSNALNRLTQGNRMDAVGYGVAAGQYGVKRAGTTMTGGDAKRRSTGEASGGGFSHWQVGSGASSAFTAPQGTRRQVGKGSASAFGPPGRSDGERGRAHSSDTSDGLAEDGLDPGLAAPGMMGHPGTMAGGESPSRLAGTSMAPMYGVPPGMSPGSAALAGPMPMGGFSPNAMAAHAAMWAPLAGQGGIPMSNDPAHLALQADMISAQMTAMGGPHLGPTMGMAPGQHAQTVQMLQTQLLRYQYMLHAMVTGAWPVGGPGNANQLPPMGMDGMAFPMPPMSGGMPGLPPGMDPMMMGMVPPPAIPPVDSSHLVTPVEGADAPPLPVSAAADVTSPFGSALPADIAPQAVGAMPPPPPVPVAVENSDAATVAAGPDAAPQPGGVIDPVAINMNRASSMPNVGMSTSTDPIPLRMPQPPPRPAPPRFEIKVEGTTSFEGESGTTPVADPAAPVADGAIPSDPPKEEAESHGEANGVLTPMPTAGSVALPGDELSAANVSDAPLTPVGADIAPAPADPAAAGAPDVAPGPPPANSGGASETPSNVDEIALKMFGRRQEEMSPDSRAKFATWLSNAPMLADSKSSESK